jgi:alpha-D-ribose 1-methylphosphonate 5-triphosphate synthase subunit PhnH
VQLVLRGPGVNGEKSVCIDGISESVVEAWKQSNSRFPAGIDLWFTTEDGRVLGIPRSTHVVISAAWLPQERN